jgi:hypothetical protein
MYTKQQNIIIIGITVIIIIVIIYFCFYKNKKIYKEPYRSLNKNNNDHGLNKIGNNRSLDKISNNAFIGAWSSDIECGNGLQYVSLASALPQNWPNLDNFFSGNINGNYSPTLSNGPTKYLISIGGSNATSAGWTNFLNNPTQTANTLYQALQSRGLAGIDFDLEGLLPSQQNNIKILVSTLKNINHNIIIMYTILLGQPDTFVDLINGFCHINVV